MKTQRQKSIDWWNSLTRGTKEEIALDNYGSTLIMDDEIEELWLKEVPKEKTYTEKEIKTMLFDAISNIIKF